MYQIIINFLLLVIFLLRNDLTDDFSIAFMFNVGQSPASILVRFAYKFAKDILIIRASDAAFRFFNMLDIFGNQGATRWPPP